MSKKTEKKQQEKVIQDRTFGLKNKNKSKTVQTYCKGVAQQVKHSGQSMNRLLEQEYEEKKRKKQEEQEQAFLASIYKTVDSIKNVGDEEEDDEDRDPKSVLCAYFKQGLCQKGRKCKYSHDMSLESKAEILDVYTDQREQLFDGDDPDNCANWDEKTLQDVVEVNSKKYKSQKPTEIVCKFFLDALEKGKYGWKWICPNGMGCHYRHCLPQGFVFKKKAAQKEENKDQEILVEDIVDQQRENLKSGGQKISKEMFFQWKEERAKRKEQDQIKASEKDQKQKGTGKSLNIGMSGRALFQFDPTVFVDDDEAADDNFYQERDEEEQIDEEEEEEDNRIHSDQEEEEEKNEQDNQFEGNNETQQEQNQVEEQLEKVEQQAEIDNQQHNVEESKTGDAEKKKKKKKKN